MIKQNTEFHLDLTYVLVTKPRANTNKQQVQWKLYLKIDCDNFQTEIDCTHCFPILKRNQTAALILILDLRQRKQAVCQSLQKPRINQESCVALQPSIVALAWTNCLKHMWSHIIHAINGLPSQSLFLPFLKRKGIDRWVQLSSDIVHSSSLFGILPDSKWKWLGGCRS